MASKCASLLDVENTKNVIVRGIYWDSSAPKALHIFIIINSLIQLYYAFGRLHPIDLSSIDSVLTHIISKGSAGIGLLDLLHIGVGAFLNLQLAPTPAIKTLAGLGFGGLAFCADWIFGGWLMYDITVLAIGQRIYGNPDWGNLLYLCAGVMGAIFGLSNCLRYAFA